MLKIEKGEKREKRMLEEKVDEACGKFEEKQLGYAENMQKTEGMLL